jgi:hypothetical protein
MASNRVEIGSALLEFGEIFDRFQGALRAEEKSL